MTMVQALSNTEEIIDRYGGDESNLIQVLLEIQKENNWLTEDALKLVSEKLGLPLSRVYRVATFYKAFSLAPRGRHTISVCLVSKVSDFDKSLSVDLGVLSGFLAGRCPAPISVSVGN